MKWKIKVTNKETGTEWEHIMDDWEISWLTCNPNLLIKKLMKLNTP